MSPSNESEATIVDQVSLVGSFEKKGKDDQFEDSTVDGVYGAEGSVSYNSTGWKGSTVLMCKTQIGLGILSIPYVLETIGIIPGLIVIFILAIMTTYSNYVVGQWKKKYPSTHSIADVGFVIFGPVGREVLGMCYWLYMVLITGSAMLSVSIAFNAITGHATCTVVFVAIAAILMFLCALVQTLEVLSIFGWIGVTSITVAVFTLAVAVSLGRPSAAPQIGDYTLKILWIADPTFAEAANAVATVVFSFGGVPSFFSIIAEMRDAKQFTKAMLWCQGFITAMYIIIGLVVYRYAAQYVSTPALGSAGPILKKICYGIALPSLVVAGILYSHLPAKYIFVRLLRGTPDMTSNSAKHWYTWISCVGFCIVVSFLVASVVPVFNGLIGVIGALLGTMMSIQTMGAMSLYMNKDQLRTDTSTKFRLHMAWNIFMIAGGFFLMISGTYGSVVGIIQTFNTPGGTTAIFSCADNSLS